MFFQRTAVHDDLKARFFCDRLGLFAHDPLLQPEDLGSDGYGLLGDGRNVLRPSKHVHHVDLYVGGDVF